MIEKRNIPIERGLLLGSSAIKNEVFFCIGVIGASLVGELMLGPVRAQENDAMGHPRRIAAFSARPIVHRSRREQRPQNLGLGINPHRCRLCAERETTLRARTRHNAFFEIRRMRRVHSGVGNRTRPEQHS